MSTRLSNIELLRIVCMFFIVMLHFLYEVISFHTLTSITANNIAYSILFSFVVCAVNVFVLISGYFGIKSKIKGVVGLYLQCVFYSVACLVVAWACGILPTQPVRESLWESILVFSHSPGWWFPVVYAILYIVAPLLNKLIDSLNKRQYIVVLIIMTFLNVYLGYFMHDQFNPTGYNVQQFIYLYFIGRFMRLHCKFDDRLKWRKYSVVAYLVSCMLWCVIGFLNKQVIHSSNAFLDLYTSVSYNNPLVIIAAISLLVFFLTIDVKNSSVRFWSSSAFSVYLITCDKYIAPVLYGAFGMLLQGVSAKYRILMLLLSSFAVLFVCMLVDKIRMILIKPLNLRLNPFLDDLEKKLRIWMKSF